MNNALSRTASEPLKSTLMVYFFVGRFIPFVVYINSIFIPFVCRNIPNSTYQAVTKRVNGFTLIELVVTMAVAAILVAVAVPNFTTTIQNGRLGAQVNDLRSDLSLAQGMTTTRPKPIKVCRSTNGTACTAGGNWRDGRAIFHDANENDILDAGELIHFREPLASAIGTLVASPQMPAIIAFRAAAQERTNVPADAFFVFCDGRAATYGKQINLNAMGLVVTKKDPPATCNPT